MTQDQIDSFMADGYLSYGQILNADEVAALRIEYDRMFEEANRTGAYRNLAGSANTTESSDEAKPRMLQIINCCERSIAFRRLIYDARILDVIEALMGPQIMLLHDQALWKPAHTGGAVYWHQDNAYWKCRPANLISCWLTLDDVTRENGAMQVIPGSHLKPVWHPTSGDTGVLLDVSGGIDTTRAIVVDLPAGGCMFHHCQTLHYTQPNNTSRQRRAFAIHFMTPGTRFTEGEHAAGIRVGFDHPMLRMP